MVQMIALGEESGNIDTLLDEVADFYQRELVYDIAHLSETIEPIFFCGRWHCSGVGAGCVFTDVEYGQPIRITWLPTQRLQPMVLKRPVRCNI